MVEFNIPIRKDFKIMENYKLSLKNAFVEQLTSRGMPLDEVVQLVTTAEADISNKSDGQTYKGDSYDNNQDYLLLLTNSLIDLLLAKGKSLDETLELVVQSEDTDLGNHQISNSVNDDFVRFSSR